MNTSAPSVSHFQLISFDGGRSDSLKFGGAALNSELNVSELKLQISVRTALEMGHFGEMIQVWVLCPQYHAVPPHSPFLERARHPLLKSKQSSY